MKYRKLSLLTLAVGSAILLAACGTSMVSQNAENEIQTETTSQEAGGAAPVENSNDGISESKSGETKILIAYFTRLDNTDNGIDEILQGGGPYGSLGDSLESADIDAISSASIQFRDGEIHGNTETLARMIQKYLGGDLFSIQTVQNYPTDYDALIDQGGEEKNQMARPELESHVENMDEYDVVLLGFPNWWYDMPMPVYSFLEEYDFTGKTVIPFATSAGSGFSGTIDTFREMLPDAVIVDDGLHIPMGNVSGADGQVADWIKELGVLQ